MESAADFGSGNDEVSGPDSITIMLGSLSKSFADVQGLRLASNNRAKAAERNGHLNVADEQRRLADALKPMEDRASRALKKCLKQHVLWSWLEPLKGLAGSQTARLMSLIGNPHRFPGQRCSEGCYFIPVHLPGATCPSVWDDEPCKGTIQLPRPGSGVRSLWHYCGLHVVNGKSPRKTKGQRADWNPEARTFVLMDKGLADQIVLQRTPYYHGIYVQKKALLTELRSVGVELSFAVDDRIGSDNLSGEADCKAAAERHLGSPDSSEGAPLFPLRPCAELAPLRPFQIDAIAKKVAAKAFVGDLLIEWKRRAPLAH